MSDYTSDDLDEAEEPAATERPIIRHVVKDLNTAVRMKKVAADAERQRRRDEMKSEAQRIRLRMSAREAASRHIAVFGPLYLLLLIAMFLAVLGTGLLDSEQVPVISALLTLLITTIGANLRTIISEGREAEQEERDAESES